MVVTMLVGDKNEFGDFRHIVIKEAKAKGGAGSIWTLENNDNFVAKIYHDHVNLNSYEPKIDAMLTTRPKALDHYAVGENFPPYTWPITKVMKSKKFVGYLMPKVDFSRGKSLERFLNKKSRHVDNLSHYTGNRHLIAHNLAQSVADIHNSGHLIVDLKPQNLIVNRRDYLISVLDTDGFSISANGRMLHPAKQFTPEYIAPEFINKTPEKVDIQQDHFALAVIIFRLFNNGIHPFQAGMKRSHKTINEMVKRRYYAYGLEGNKGLIPSRFSEHSVWPTDLREAFDQAFKSKDRPTGRDWVTLLSQFNPNTNSRAKKCSLDINHVILDDRCPSCEINEKLKTPEDHHSNRSHARTEITKAKTTSPSKNSSQPKNKSFLKINLLKQSLISSVLIYFTFSLGWHYFSENSFDVFIWIRERFETNLAWTLFYIVILAVLYYRSNRGNPHRDCPNCGAFAGSLKFLRKEESFIRWKHQTKSGRPDKRYRSNPKLFEMTTYWHCSYCESDLKFVHELAASPNKIRTKVKSRSIM